jgi:hypothetical protein
MVPFAALANTDRLTRVCAGLVQQPFLRSVAGILGPTAKPSGLDVRARSLNTTAACWVMRLTTCAASRAHRCARRLSELAEDVIVK